MQYDSDSDPLCYPGSSTLINLADLRNDEALEQFELAAFLTRAAEPLPAGDLDLKHYRAVHHHPFQDVYAWAGQRREIRTGKGGNWFCYPEFIEDQATALFATLIAADHFGGLPVETFAAELAHFISELNVIHYFREGNGRAQFTFMLMLAHYADHPIDVARIDEAEILGALIEAFKGREARLANHLRSAMSQVLRGDD